MKFWYSKLLRGSDETSEMLFYIMATELQRVIVFGDPYNSHQHITQHLNKVFRDPYNSHQHITQHLNIVFGDPYNYNCHQHITALVIQGGQVDLTTF